MAIFRAGKRIGPFDIRGGISRGFLATNGKAKILIVTIAT